MSISEPFIRRPIGTSLLMLGVLVFGIGAYGLLPVAPLPNVDFPTITVTASYPGASPQTMASAIATPLEQQFTQIPALDQMTSLSGIGTMSITAGSRSWPTAGALPLSRAALHRISGSRRRCAMAAFGMRRSEPFCGAARRRTAPNYLTAWIPVA